MTEHAHRATGDIWGRPGLGEAILEALRNAGKDLDALTLEDVAPLDQFHAGGLGATRALARLVDPRPGTRVLDVGGGLGGPARLLATEFGCQVTVLDLTEDYLRAGERLTARLGLQDRVRFQLGDALAVPFPDAHFDVVWTQNSGMNIADKRALYTGFRRVLRDGGRLALQEPVAGPGGPPHFPLMWAPDPSASFLVTAAALRALIEAAGFRALSWEARSAGPAAPPTAGAGAPPVTVQALVMGERLAAIQAAATRSRQEGRLADVQALFERTQRRDARVTTTATVGRR